MQYNEHPLKQCLTHSDTETPDWLHGCIPSRQLLLWLSSPTNKTRKKNSSSECTAAADTNDGVICKRLRLRLAVDGQREVDQYRRPHARPMPIGNQRRSQELPNE